jgi:hypothetical protein
MVAVVIFSNEFAFHGHEIEDKARITDNGGCVRVSHEKFS